MNTTKQEMIDLHLKRRGVRDPKVLDAMRKVDRTLFVPDELKNYAYEDRALPIGKAQTISQPYIVAYMAQELKLEPDDVVLEVGTGCGYNAAVLSKIVKHVYSIEIIEWLADLAKKNIKKADIGNVSARYGDGYKGWPEEAPFDAIILTAAPPRIPEPLKKQLKIKGKMILPVGREHQKLILMKRTKEDQFKTRTLILVKFVPMTGEAQISS